MPESAVLERGVVSDIERDEVFQLSESGAISESDIAHDEELRDRYRELGRNSLYFWTKAVLGYPDLTPRTHLPYANFLQDLNMQHTLGLMPRGCYKTTVGTIGFGSRHMVFHPDEWVLISNQTELNVERMVIEIEGHFDGSNPVMNWLFPEKIKPGDKWKPWTSKMMTLPGRSVISGTPSLTAMGVGAKVESWHFHVIIRDDLIGEKAMHSQREMLAAIDWHDYSTSLFVNPRTGISRDHGTRWDLGDLYSILLADPKYHLYIKPAKDPLTGELLFPEILDEDTLTEIRNRNYGLYMSQYLNDPENPEALDFDRRWLKKYRLIKTPKGPACEMDGTIFYCCDGDIVLTVDPAASGDMTLLTARGTKRGRTQKSNNAVTMWMRHPSGYYFLLDCWVGRAKSGSPELQVMEKVLKMLIMWRGYCRKSYMESYGAQRALITVFKMLCQQNNCTFPMEEIPRGIQTAKDVRIRTALGAPGENGQICIRHCHDRFEYEFGRFNQDPNAKDVLDASAWAFRMLRILPSEAVTEVRGARHKRKRRRFRMGTGKTGY